MSSDDSLNFSSGRRDEPHDMGTPNSSESIDKILLARRAKEKASRSREYQLV